MPAARPDAYALIAALTLGACSTGDDLQASASASTAGLTAATSTTSVTGASESDAGTGTDATASGSTSATTDASTSTSTTTTTTTGASTDPTSSSSTTDPTTGCTPDEPPDPKPWDPADVGDALADGVLACVKLLGYATDDRLPDDQRYGLTTFGGPGDEQPVSCGFADADGTWYYAANAQRFPCGQKVRLVDDDRSACVIVQVADLGPHECVEAAAELPIWDVSPLAADALYGIQSAGWSEKIPVIGAPVGDDQPLGPCPAPDPKTALQGYIGGPCTDPADCDVDGAICETGAEWPGGHCSTPCTESCPDGVGPVAYTACGDLGGGVTECLARCDYTLFASGCRDGYGCFPNLHPVTKAERRVCLPVACL